jgi:hypothetical protein
MRDWVAGSFTITTGGEIGYGLSSLPWQFAVPAWARVERAV